MVRMPLRRSHFHGRQRDDGALNLGRDAHDSAPWIVEKRVTTLTTIYASATEDADASTATEGNLDVAGDAGSTTTSGSNLSDLPPVIEASTAVQGTDTTLAVDPNGPTSSTITPSTTSTSATTATPVAASASASSTSTSSSGSSGNDAATKAGIALGVLGGLFIILAFVYYLLSRRRKQMEEEQQRRLADDEKLNGPFDDSQPPRTPAKAPRLSLRPMTQLFTGAGFNTSAQADQQASKGSDIAMVAGSSGKRTPGTSAWERPMTSDSQNDRNPFGNDAQILEESTTPNNPMSPMSPISESSMPSPGFTAGLTPAPRVSAITMDSATVPPITTKSLPPSPSSSTLDSPVNFEDEAFVGRAISSPEPQLAPTGSMLSAATAVERRQSMRKENVPAPLDLTLPPKFPGIVPPSPSGTEFSIHEVEPDQSPVPSASAAEIAAAGGPANTTVHRVQLDFSPSLDDEMDVRAGQLVRLLHEYDDGWVSGFYI